MGVWEYLLLFALYVGCSFADGGLSFVVVPIPVQNSGIFTGLGAMGGKFRVAATPAVLRKVGSTPRDRAPNRILCLQMSEWMFIDAKFQGRDKTYFEMPILAPPFGERVLPGEEARVQLTRREDELLARYQRSLPYSAD